MGVERSGAVETGPDSIRGLTTLNDNLHSAHCRACKERVHEILAAIYGDCGVNHVFPWPTNPQAYINTPLGDCLIRIRSELGNFRGHRDFVRSAQVPPCDYFISDPPFIVEFDENQHFTHPRLITLSLYPEESPMGFSVARWQKLCRELDANDDEPYDRDERRAWYDTLRDLLPNIYGFKPTVRLYAEEFKWCGLNASLPPDCQAFRTLLGDRLPKKIR